MRAGIVPLFRRAERHFDASDVCFAARNQIAPLLAGEYPDHPVNILKREGDDMLFINGRIREYGDLAKQVEGTRLSTRFMSPSGETVAVLFKLDPKSSVGRLATPADYINYFGVARNNFADFDTSATLYSYTWEIMADIEREIVADYNAMRDGFTNSPDVRLHEGAHLVDPDSIQLEHNVEVRPGAVVDASHGPIYVGPNTRIESHATIYGPSSIGPNTVVVAGKIEKCSIGHTCRVGGEVEESIFQSYVNKYHAGFIGHSYVGSWVNFGAMTTNSDLKNNYSNIRVSLDGQMMDTGSIKVGSFIGDHTKFGIGTLLNTGINIGVCCNIFGGSLVTDKEVPSFMWGGSGNFVPYKFDKALETARMTASRRDYTLSTSEESALAAICDNAMSDEGVVDF
jgi:UDP-N-acetylglucosamine diphosphorylase/glucosamine-1-phosphate N-acetyltransferase